MSYFLQDSLLQKTGVKYQEETNQNVVRQIQQWRTNPLRISRNLEPLVNQTWYETKYNTIPNNFFFFRNKSYNNTKEEDVFQYRSDKFIYYMQNQFEYFKGWNFYCTGIIISIVQSEQLYYIYDEDENHYGIHLKECLDCYLKSYSKEKNFFSDLIYANASSYYNISSRPWFSNAVEKKKESFTDLYLYVTMNGEKNIGITYSLPVFDEKNEIVAVIGVDISVKDVDFAIKENNGFGEHGSSFVFMNENYKMISSTKVPLQELMNMETQEITDVRKMSDQEQKNAVDAISRDVGLQIESTKVVWFGNIVDRYIAFISPIKIADSQWNFVSVVAFDKDFMLEFKIPIFLFLIFAVICVLISVLISILVSYFVTRPLSVIQNQMENLSNLSFLKKKKPKFSTLRNFISGLLKLIYGKKIVPDKKFTDIKIQSKKNGIIKKIINSHFLSFFFSPFIEIRTVEKNFVILQNSMKVLTKYVPVSLIRRLQMSRKPVEFGLELADMSVMFIDVRNFTEISESLEPRSLVKVMQEIFETLTIIIKKNHGIVDKYIGDSIMVFFNAPIQNLKKKKKEYPHEFLSCFCAIQMVSTVEKNNKKKWKELNFPEIGIKIGINSGNMLVGNYGTRDRFNYTVLGDNVNVAARLEPLNSVYGTNIICGFNTLKKVQSIISDLKLEQMQKMFQNKSEFSENNSNSKEYMKNNKLEFVCRTIDFVTVKGKKEEEILCEIVSIRKIRNNSFVKKTDINDSTIVHSQNPNSPYESESSSGTEKSFPTDDYDYDYVISEEYDEEMENSQHFVNFYGKNREKSNLKKCNQFQELFYTFFISKNFQNFTFAKENASMLDDDLPTKILSSRLTEKEFGKSFNFTTK